MRDAAPACACGSGHAYGDCCGRWHGGEAAPTAVALMRSRYCAYALRREDYLLATWHPDTRPVRLGLADEVPGPTWLGLRIVDSRETGPGQAEVEFVARSRVGGGRAQRLHERSRFRRIEGRWYYLDGVFPDAAAPG